MAWPMPIPAPVTRAMRPARGVSIYPLRIEHRAWTSRSNSQSCFYLDTGVSVHYVRREYVNITSFALRNPLVVGGIAVALCLFGLFAFASLGVAITPNVNV